MNEELRLRKRNEQLKQYLWGNYWGFDRREWVKETTYGVSKWELDCEIDEWMEKKKWLDWIWVWPKNYNVYVHYEPPWRKYNTAPMIQSIVRSCTRLSFKPLQEKFCSWDQYFRNATDDVLNPRMKTCSGQNALSFRGANTGMSYQWMSNKPPPWVVLKNSWRLP